MNIDLNTLVIICGLIANILAVVGYSNRHERRLTRVETLVSVLASRGGIHLRTGDRMQLKESADDPG